MAKVARGQIGMYNGIRWSRRRIDDVLCVEVGGSLRWYFIDGVEDFEADHFRTQAELFAFIDDRVRLSTLPQVEERKQ